MLDLQSVPAFRARTANEFTGLCLRLRNRVPTARFGTAGNFTSPTESRGEDTGGTERQVVPQIGRHDHAPLLTPPTATGDEQPAGREPWFTAFVDVLVDHGADETVTVAAVDRLADLFTTRPRRLPVDTTIADYAECDVRTVRRHSGG